MTDKPYNRAIHCKPEQLNTLLNRLKLYSVEYYTYVNMRVLMDEHKQEVSILVKEWNEIPDRAKTEILLLAYAVIDCDIDPATLKDTTLPASID